MKKPVCETLSQTGFYVFAYAGSVKMIGRPAQDSL